MKARGLAPRHKTERSRRMDAPCAPCQKKAMAKPIFIPIDRAHNQPFHGHFWPATLPDMEILPHWMPIAPEV